MSSIKNEEFKVPNGFEELEIDLSKKSLSRIFLNKMETDREIEWDSTHKLVDWSSKAKVYQRITQIGVRHIKW